MKLRFDESSRTSLTGLSVLLRNAMFIFILMNPVGSILGRSRKSTNMYPLDMDNWISELLSHCKCKFSSAALEFSNDFGQF